MGASALMTPMPIVIGHDARSERVANWARKREGVVLVAVAVTGQRRVRERSPGSVGHD